MECPSGMYWYRNKTALQAARNNEFSKKCPEIASGVRLPRLQRARMIPSIGAAHCRSAHNGRLFGGRLSTRRTSLFALGSALIAPLPALAQQRAGLRRIGILGMR